MKRTLRVEYEIDSGDVVCGNCAWETRGWCALFSEDLDYASDPHNDEVRFRCPDCLENEVVT